jgi:hypothetical protein
MAIVWRRYSYAALVGCAAGAVIGSSAVLDAYGAESSLERAVAGRHSARVAERATREDPHGALEPIQVTPVFDSLTNQASGASALFHLEVDDTGAGDSRVAYAWELSNESGAVLASRDGAALGQLARGGVFASEGWELLGLKDGLYRVQISVAANGSKPGASAGSLLDWWLEVRGGQIDELEASTWLARSETARGSKRTTGSSRRIVNDTASEPVGGQR